MNNSERKPAQVVTANVPHFEPLLDSDEAAVLLKIYPKTLQRMARNGEITGVQIGKLWPRLLQIFGPSLRLECDAG